MRATKKKAPPVQTNRSTLTRAKPKRESKPTALARPKGGR